MKLKYILNFLFVFMLSSCMNMMAGANKVVEKTYRSYRNVEQVKSDNDLKRELKKSLSSDVKMFADINNMKKIGKYNINVFEGRVLLTGIVADTKIKNYIYNRVWENNKVKEVINELISSNPVKQEIAKDYFKEKSLNSRLFGANNVKSVNYNTSVVNGNAYIIGVAKDETEIAKVGYIASTTRGIKKTYLFVIKENDQRRIED